MDDLIRVSEWIPSFISVGHGDKGEFIHSL